MAALRTLRLIGSTVQAVLSSLVTQLNLSLRLIEASLSHSTTEAETGGLWVDGSPIYRKEVLLNPLPNATQVAYDHGITGLSRVISVRGHATGPSDWIPLPYPAIGADNQDIRVYVDSEHVQVKSAANWSSYVGYVTLEYTKS